NIGKQGTEFGQAADRQGAQFPGVEGSQGDTYLLAVLSALARIDDDLCKETVLRQGRHGDTQQGAKRNEAIGVDADADARLETIGSCTTQASCLDSGETSQSPPTAAIRPSKAASILHDVLMTS